MAINVVMIRSVDFYVPFHPSTQIQHMFTFLIRDPRQLTRLSTPAHSITILQMRRRGFCSSDILLHQTSYKVGMTRMTLRVCI